MIVLVRKVIFKIPDDSLISAEPSDILSILKKKKRTKKKTKSKPDRGTLMHSVALEIRALI